MESIQSACTDDQIDVRPLSSQDRARMAELFKALSDETRLEVFRLIAGQAKPICVCDITPRFPVSQPTISHHLKVLREAGLVTVSRRGNWSFFSVDPAGLQRLADCHRLLGIELLNGVP